MKFDALRVILTCYCYCQFHKVKSGFLERSCSPLSNNVSNFLFHFVFFHKKMMCAFVPVPTYESNTKIGGKNPTHRQKQKHTRKGPHS
jgi:hypothetical protein